MADRRKVDPKKWGVKGVECPRCGCRRSKVAYVRNQTRSIMRARQCENESCGYRWQTRERTLEDDD